MRTLLARALGVHTEERAWRVGAKGEQTVGRELERLGDQWTIVHDVPVGDRGANIDHVVVGRRGSSRSTASGTPARASGSAATW